MPGGLALNELAAHSFDRASGWGTAPAHRKHAAPLGIDAAATMPIGRHPLAQLPDVLCCFFAASKQVNAQSNDNHRVK